MGLTMRPPNIDNAQPMGQRAERADEIQNFILRKVLQRSTTVAQAVAYRFGCSRTAANNHIGKLVDKGMIRAFGETQARRYLPIPIREHNFETPIHPDLEEDLIWKDAIRPQLGELSPLAEETWAYAITEMVNNAIDHSEGTLLGVGIFKFHGMQFVVIGDNGVGIFRKIQKALGLSDPRHSILHLAKGKFTTDSSRHSGEGIFFTSRAVDAFQIISKKLKFQHVGAADEYTLSGGGRAYDLLSTAVLMGLVDTHDTPLAETFDKFTDGDGSYGFNSTVVPIYLAQYADDFLVSRSQAKRVLRGLSEFHRVIFDFTDVDKIGQAFAHEIFNVFRNNNPATRLEYANTTDDVRKMILRAWPESLSLIHI